MKNIIFIAPPAAGKGTISEYLIKNLNYTHLSTGDLLRKVAKQDNENGKKIRSLMKEGKFIPDEIILPLFKDELLTLKDKPFILDGMPRTLKQAKYLDNLFQEIDLNNYIVLSLNVDKEILKERIIGRRICPDCGSSYNIYFEGLKPKDNEHCDNCGSSLIQREDDNLEAFQVRYQAYLEETEPLITFYKEKKVLQEIDGTKQPLEIQNDVDKLLRNQND